MIRLNDDSVNDCVWRTLCDIDAHTKIQHPTYIDTQIAVHGAMNRLETPRLNVIFEDFWHDIGWSDIW